MPQIVRSVVAVLLVIAVPLGRVALSADVDAASETARLLGSWDCSDSVRGSSSSAAYRRVNDATLDLTMQVHLADGVAGNVRERLAYDRAKGVWSLDAGKSRFYDAEHLDAPAWTAPQWTFTGEEASRGSARPVRIVYSTTLLDTFVREHQAMANGRWVTDGAFLCRRAPLDPRYDAGVLLPEGDDVPRASVARKSPAPPQRRPNGQPSVTASAPPRVALRSVSGRHASGESGADRAYDLTHGIWDCKTFGGAEATHTYTREADGSIQLHNVLSIAKHTYALDETYRFDRATERWTAATSGGAYSGTAGRWLGDTWVFEGDMPLDGRRVPVRMIYSRLGERAFRRDFVRIQDGAPATFAAETCLLRQR